MTNKTPIKYRRRNTSMPEDIDRGARLLARQRGHDNVSRLFQDLTVDELERVIGPDWRERVNADDDERNAA